MAEVSGKKLIPVLGVAGLAFIGLGYFISQDLGEPARANRARLLKDAGVVKNRLPEGEREAYLRDQLVVEGFKVEPEIRADTNKPVPGLLRVTGQIKNTGEFGVDTLILFVNTKNEQGAVVSTFQQNLIEREPLAPGQARRFRFRIPAREKFADFDYRLR
ncbi:MAG: FxLYD domain-containing protein [Myxococcota bacterium]